MVIRTANEIDKLKEALYRYLNISKPTNKKWLQILDNEGCTDDDLIVEVLKEMGKHYEERTRVYRVQDLVDLYNTEKRHKANEVSCRYCNGLGTVRILCDRFGNGVPVLEKAKAIPDVTTSSIICICDASKRFYKEYKKRDFTKIKLAIERYGYTWSLGLQVLQQRNEPTTDTNVETILWHLLNTKMKQCIQLWENQK